MRAASAMSLTFKVGLVGVSSQTSFVFGLDLTASSSAPGIVKSIKEKVFTLSLYLLTYFSSRKDLTITVAVIYQRALAVSHNIKPNFKYLAFSTYFQ